MTRLSRFTPFVRKAQIHQGPMRTAAERNVRVPVGVNPQAAPDPPREGFVPTRHAVVQIATYAYDMGVSLDDPRFQTVNLVWDPAASVPQGRVTPFGQRQNIAQPAHVAYGAMLANNYQPDPYWGY